MKVRPWLMPLIRQSLLAVVFVGLGILMLAWLMGAFSPKVGTDPDNPTSATSGNASAKSHGDTYEMSKVDLIEVRKVALPIVESAVGSVQPVHGAQVASNILAKVTEADLRAGQEVKKDQVLIRLELADLRARLQQAQAGFRDAVSARERAKSDLEQLQQLFDRQASTKRELDNAQTTLERAQAMVDRANQAILEAQTVMDYATIKAPMDGIIIDKLVNVGDTVTPGQVLVNLYDPSKMQVVASVREALAQQLEVGRTVRVELESMDLVCKANISEIVPESAGSSRSFAVKVTGPCPPGVHVGTFARLLMDMGTQETLVIPADAVQRVGQLDLVNVMNQKRTQWQRRVIKPGRLVEDGKSIEVLSGLKAGELVIVLPAEGRGHE